MPPVGSSHLPVLVLVSCISLMATSCENVTTQCSKGEAVLFSQIGKTAFNDYVCVICPDGSQYRVLMRPSRDKSFLFAQGISLRQPLIVTVHSLSKNTTEDHIYLSNAHNGELQPIPTVSGQQVLGSLSPDGSRVAYEAELDLKNPPRLAVTEISSGKTTLVPSNEGEYYQAPAWSPDGKELMFVSLRRGKGSTPILSSLMRAPYPFSSAVTVFGSDELIGSAAYSPEGKRFAIWSINGLEIVDGSTLRRAVVFPTRSLIGRKPGTAGLIWGRHSDTLAFTLFNLRTSASELWAVHESGRDAHMIFNSRESELYVGSFVDQ